MHQSEREAPHESEAVRKITKILKKFPPEVQIKILQDSLPKNRENLSKAIGFAIKQSPESFGHIISQALDLEFDDKVGLNFVLESMCAIKELTANYN